MNTTKRFALALGAALSLAAAPRALPAQVGIDVGAQAPGAALQTLDGKPADLKQFTGKGVTVIEFWATWCENCRELEPTLKATIAKYANRVHFVGVAVSVNQSPARVKQFVAKHQLPGTQLFDTHGNATGAYDVPATSYVVILDAKGRVSYTGLGGKQDLDAAIQKALKS